ncbi:uncharacterized protein LOC135168158 [Diachasmimorpha longicaudata]|uniref:uncharacterized protein LOC135168158 n=1 Tax=Diachasmimorpha longicaudata TaxID=58733 RepID=UPI0030B8C91C
MKQIFNIRGHAIRFSPNIGIIYNWEVAYQQESPRRNIKYSLHKLTLTSRDFLKSKKGLRDIYCHQKNKQLKVTSGNITTEGMTGVILCPCLSKFHPPTLGESKDMALKRFNFLERKLNKDANLKKQYHAVIAEYLSLEHMSKATDTSSLSFYLPHHAVIKENRLTTKVRVVFDGSSKTSNGISLNETLMVGPTIQDHLFSLIIQFRSHQYVLTRDTEKMYRQFLVHPYDRKYQRILWRDENDEITTYQLNTVTFGLSAAPFLAIRCLQQLARDESKNFPIASGIHLKDLDVDDLLTGFDSVEDARHVQAEITQLLSTGGLNIRQWASNEDKILQGLSPEHINQHLQLYNDTTIKTLGISWDSKLDAIKYKTKPINLNNAITKRTILSIVASILDTLGLLGRVILKAKNIIQQLWAAKVDWDESVPLAIQTLWIDLCSELPLVNELEFHRKVIIKDPQEIQIDGFCEGSNVGYGACIYLKSINNQGLSQINLLCSKSQVAPIKTPVRIPRLELCGAHTLTMLYESVKKSINLPISKTILWTDSTITIHWIHTPPHTLKTFVQNRVADIQQKTMNSNENCEWKDVPSGDNPADALSRGQLPSEFMKDKLWLNGPHWLKQTPEHWPQ